MINKVGESVSFLTVFVGLKGSKEDLGIQAHNCWHFTRLVFIVDFLYQNQMKEQFDLIMSFSQTLFYYTDFLEFVDFMYYYCIKGYFRPV